MQQCAKCPGPEGLRGRGSALTRVVASQNLTEGFAGIVGAYWLKSLLGNGIELTGVLLRDSLGSNNS